MFDCCLEPETPAPSFSYGETIPLISSYKMNQPMDLEQVVKDWAWREFDRTATKKQRRLREKEKTKSQTYLQLRVDWSDVKFTDITRWPRIEEDVFDDMEKQDSNANNTMMEAKVADAAADAGKIKTSVLYRTKFTNDTSSDQEYTMRTEKTTRSSATTEIETGYTRGIEMSVTLKTPCEVFEANAGYHREMSLINISGETQEEEITWGVESVIKVKANHVAEAQLVVNEKKYKGSFEVESKLRGVVYVTFSNVRDNNSFVKLCGNDIGDIIKKHLEMKRRIGESLDYVEVEDGQVTIHTKGKCMFRYGVKQEILVRQEPYRSK